MTKKFSINHCFGIFLSNKNGLFYTAAIAKAVKKLAKGEVNKESVK